MKSDARPELLRKMNVRKILEVLREKGPSSRAEITRLSGISAPTVSKVVANLLGSGLIEEGEAPAKAVGRPGRHLRLAGDSVRVVGIELNVGKWRMTVTGFDGDVSGLEIQEFDVPGDYEQLMADLEAKVAPIKADPSFELLGVGVSTPGLINSTEERVVLSPNLGITNGHQVGEDLKKRLGVPCVMLQEANAHCLAERLFGGAGGDDDFALMDVTAGLGVGAVVSGDLFTGSSGYAGELGHVRVDATESARQCGCGKFGCLETVATEAALCAEIDAATGGVGEGHSISIEEALDRIRAGDAVANQALDKTLEHFAVAMSFVINVLNPRALFIYSQLLNVRDGLFDSLVSRAKELSLAPPGRECVVKPAQATKTQGAIAAILRHLMQEQGPLR